MEQFYQLAEEHKVHQVDLVVELMEIQGQQKDVVMQVVFHHQKVITVAQVLLFQDVVKHLEVRWLWRCRW